MDAMRTSLHDQSSRYKDGLAPRSLPSDALAQQVAHLADAGRPVLDLGRVDGSARSWIVRVPDLGAILAPVRISPGTFALKPPGEDPAVVLRPRLALALTTGSLLAIEQLTATDRSEWRRLTLAALHDIAGLDVADLTALAEFRDERTTRDDLRRARALLGRLGAWPWHCFAQGRPPSDWRRSLGATPRADAAWRIWATGRASGRDLSALVT
jgi:hypothetical protein